MKLSHAGRLVALMTTVVFASTGCGGTVAPTGGVPQSLARATATHRGSWMLPGTSAGVLIYATGGCGGTCVLSYPEGKVVGSLGVQGNGACSDANGNVFITSSATVTEYAHGGTSPINTLSLPGGTAQGCSVDPTTNDLAVVFVGNGKDIAIFANEQGSPSLYQSTLNSSYCGYDASGNLVVDGYYNGEYIGLSELPMGSSTFTRLTINGTLDDPPMQVQWDGHYVSYESAQRGNVRVQRLSVSGSTATVVHTIHLRRITARATQSWTYGNVIVVPYGAAAGGGIENKVGVWKYPKGGNPIDKYTNLPDKPDFRAVTVSG